MRAVSLTRSRRFQCESLVAARGLQERINQLEMNLDEERQNGDQLMDRIDRGREQVKHTREHGVIISSCHSPVLHVLIDVSHFPP